MIRFPCVWGKHRQYVYQVEIKLGGETKMSQTPSLPKPKLQAPIWRPQSWYTTSELPMISTAATINAYIKQTATLNENNKTTNLNTCYLSMYNKEKWKNLNWQ